MRPSLVFGAALLSCSAAMAGSVTFAGNTTGDPTWNRPVAGSPPTLLSGVGTAVPYEVQQFYVSAGGSYTFQSTATVPSGWDNYTFLYEDSFNPVSQFTDVLTGNDDNPTIGLSGFSFNLVTGKNYFMVTTGFANSDFGAYSNSIRGEGDITLGALPPPNDVPEPTTLALLGLAGLGMGATRRRKT